MYDKMNVCLTYYYLVIGTNQKMTNNLVVKTIRFTSSNQRKLYNRWKVWKNDTYKKPITELEHYKQKVKELDKGYEHSSKQQTTNVFNAQSESLLCNLLLRIFFFFIPYFQ